MAGIRSVHHQADTAHANAFFLRACVCVCVCVRMSFLDNRSLRTVHYTPWSEDNDRVSVKHILRTSPINYLHGVIRGRARSIVNSTQRFCIESSKSRQYSQFSSFLVVFGWFPGLLVSGGLLMVSSGLLVRRGGPSRRSCHGRRGALSLFGDLRWHCTCMCVYNQQQAKGHARSCKITYVRMNRAQSGPLDFLRKFSSPSTCKIQ